MREPPHLLLYDSDCGFCAVVAASITRLDRDDRLRPVAIQSPEGAEALPEIDEPDRLQSFHLKAPDGTVHSAGAALERLAALLPGAGPLRHGLTANSSVTERLYRVIAGNRHRLGPLIPEAVKRRSRAELARRST